MNEVREKLGKLKIHHFGGNNNPRALTRPTPYLKYREVMDIIESVNTPKHETVEELRKAYEALSVNWIHTQTNINESPVRVCLSCGNTWDDHKVDCISKKAIEWLENHGKPEDK